MQQRERRIIHEFHYRDAETALEKMWQSGIFFCVPRKIRQLVADLERGGFTKIHGGKGSHRKFVHPKFRGFVLISGHDGEDAQHYQEKQLRNALRQIQ